MSYIYYNPETMTNQGTILTNVHPADMSDTFTKAYLRFHKPYESREDAVSEDSSCDLYFYEDGVLYEATKIAAWQWQPCTDVECNSGINWHTYYAQTVEKLREYLVGVYGSICDFTPRLNQYGLYEIQVHYDGRCR